MSKTIFVVIIGTILLFVLTLFASLAHADNPGAQSSVRTNKGNITTASQDLRNGIQQKSLKLVKKAVEELAKENTENAFNTLVSSVIPLADNPETLEYYWIILKGISHFSSKNVIPKITDLILRYKDKDLGKTLLAAMKDNQTTDILPLLDAVIEKGTPEMQIECAHQLSNIREKASLDVLFKTLASDNEKDKSKSALAEEIYNVLYEMTGINARSYEFWMNWWKNNKDKNSNEIIKRKELVENPDTISGTRILKGPKNLPPDKILVVRNDEDDEYIQKAGGKGFDGNFDHIQDVMKAMDLPYQLIGKSELEKDSFSLDDKWALIFNCNFFMEHCVNPEHLKMPPTNIKGGIRSQQCPGTSNHIPLTTELSSKAIKKIQRFVENGGYLFTEDLNIMEIVQRAFPKIIEQSMYFHGQTVRILPEPSAVLHPYLKYVFEAPPVKGDDEDDNQTRLVKPGEMTIDAEWKIDEESPNIKIMPVSAGHKNAVTALIVSPELARINKDEGAVAVTFNVSDQSIVATGNSEKPGGRVLHVMSHFGKQRSKLVNEFALQNLLANFLDELSKRPPKGIKIAKK